MEATIGSDYMPKRLSRPSEYAYEDGCRPLGKFAGVLSVTLLVYAIVSVLLALALSYTFVDARMLDEYAFEDATDDDYLLIIASSLVFLLYVAERALFIICAFTVARFTYRAMRNLYTVRSTVPDMSPGATVYWYFVPIATWFLPAKGMSEIHQGSIEETGALNTSNLVSWWWGTWLVMSILSFISNFMGRTDPIMSIAVGIVSIVLGAVSAFFLRKLVRRIRTAQDQFSQGNLAETFA